MSMPKRFALFSVSIMDPKIFILCNSGYLPHLYDDIVEFVRVDAHTIIFKPFNGDSRFFFQNCNQVSDAICKGRQSVIIGIISYFGERTKEFAVVYFSIYNADIQRCGTILANHKRYLVSPTSSCRLV